MLEGIEQELGGGGNGVGLGPSASQISVAMEDVGDDDEDKSNDTSGSGEDGEYMPVVKISALIAPVTRAWCCKVCFAIHFSEI